MLKGQPEITRLANDADFIAISVISRLEFFSFSALTQADKNLFDHFVALVDVVDLSMQNQSLLDAVSAIRINSSLKLPDAIVMASAKSVGATLVTADIKLANYAGDHAILFKPN